MLQGWDKITGRKLARGIAGVYIPAVVRGQGKCICKGFVVS